MEHTMTYKSLLRMFQEKKYKSEKYIASMQYKLDVYFANNRITSDEYEELLKLLEQKEETKGN